MGSVTQPLSAWLQNSIREDQQKERADKLDSVRVRMARACIGRAIKQGVGDANFKRFGTPSVVAGWCQGEGMSALVGIWHDEHARRRALIALCREAGADVTTAIQFKESL